MFEKTSAGEGMKELAQIYFSLPCLLTFFGAVIFFILGIYGLFAKSRTHSEIQTFIRSVICKQNEIE